MAVTIQSRKRPFFVCLTLVFCLAAPQGFSQDFADDDKAKSHMRLIAEGWSANFESFASYRCRVQMRQGRCTGIEKARQNGPETEVSEADATLVVDGQNMCYIQQSNEKPRPNPASGGVSIGLTSMGLLVNDQHALDVSFLAGAAVLKTKSEWKNPGIDATTWNGAGAVVDYDRGHFGPLLNQLLTHAPIGLRLYEPTTMRDALVTRIDMPLGSESRLSWYIDEQRGFLPVEMESFFKENLSRRVYITDIREFSGGRWFPMRCVAVWVNGDEQDGDHTVREILVTDLEVDIKPRPEEFQISLPKGFRIERAEVLGSVMMLPGPKVFGLNDLADWDQRTVRKAKVRAAAASPPNEDGSRVIWIAAAMGAALVVIGIALFLRHRKT